MSPKLAELLSEEQLPRAIQSIQEDAKQMIQISRRRMQDFYEGWDNTDKLFQIKRKGGSRDTAKQDDRDKRADERDQPASFTLPFLHSQMDTAISLGESLIKERPSFFEPTPKGMEDQISTLIAQSVLQRDVEHSNFDSVGLKQFLTNGFRYSIAPLKYSWLEEIDYEQGETPLEGAAFAGLTEPGIVPRISFQGNKVISLSPFKFFPDVRVSLHDLQSGEYCGDEQSVHYNRLKSAELQGVIAGLRHVGELKARDLSNRKTDLTNDSLQVDLSTDPTVERHQLKNVYVLTEVQVKLIPSEYREKLLADGVEEEAVNELFDDREFPVTYLIWYLNDDRLVRIEELGYPNNNFTYSVGLVSPDDENYIAGGFPEKLKPIQEICDWLINSHIRDIRNNVDRKFVVDPAGVRLDDLTGDKKIVRLNEAASHTGVDKWIQELPVTNSTNENVANIQLLMEYAKEGTGITENLMGSFAKGRRSSREAGNVHANATQRIKSAVEMLWQTGIQPLGKAMLANHQSFLTEPQLIKTIGVPDYFAQLPAEIPKFLNVTKEHIKGSYDFSFSNALLPSDRAENSRILQDLILQVLQNPQALQIMLALGYDVSRLFEEFLRERGLKNANRFKIAPGEIERISQAIGASGLAIPVGGLEGVPGQQNQIAPAQPNQAAGAGTQGTIVPFAGP